MVMKIDELKEVVMLEEKMAGSIRKVEKVTEEFTKIVLVFILDVSIVLATNVETVNVLASIVLTCRVDTSNRL